MRLSLLSESPGKYQFVKCWYKMPTRGGSAEFVLSDGTDPPKALPWNTFEEQEVLISPEALNAMRAGKNDRRFCLYYDSINRIFLIERRADGKADDLDNLSADDFEDADKFAYSDEPNIIVDGAVFIYDDQEHHFYGSWQQFLGDHPV